MVRFTIFTVQAVGCPVRDNPVGNFSTNLYRNVQARAHPNSRGSYLRARSTSDFNIGMNAVFFKVNIYSGNLGGSGLVIGSIRNLGIAGCR